MEGANRRVAGPSGIQVFIGMKARASWGLSDSPLRQKHAFESPVMLLIDADALTASLFF
jgi:hypothetical protein